MALMNNSVGMSGVPTPSLELVGVLAAGGGGGLLLPVDPTSANSTAMHDYDRDEALAQVEIGTLALIFGVTLLGNGAVLIALYIRRRYSGRKKLSRMYFFILHLSIADLVTAFFNVLPQLAWEVTYRFRGGGVLCKAVKFSQPLGPYLSSYVLTATAIDRHQAICYPLTYCSWTSRRSRAMIWTAWICSLLFCIPQLVIFSYQEIAPGIYDCWATFPVEWGEKTYVTWYSISVFIVPLCVLVFTYSCICREIWRNAGGGMPLQAMTSPPSSPKRRPPLISRAKINTVKQTIAVIAMYIGCSSPFIGAQLWATWDPNAYKSPFWTGATFTILTLLSSLNSCVNPWIYLCFNNDLRKLLKQLIFSKCRCSQHQCNTGATSSAGSNSSQAVETTTLRVPSRISFYSTLRNGKQSLQRQNNNPRHYVQYKPHRWVTASPSPP